jgi:predicted acetyltransferase
MIIAGDAIFIHEPGMLPSNTQWWNWKSGQMIGRVGLSVRLRCFFQKENTNLTYVVARQARHS